MKSPRFSGLLALVLGCGFCMDAKAQTLSSPRTDAFGRPTVSEAGNQIIYPSDPSPAELGKANQRFTPPVTLAPAATTPTLPWNGPASPGGQPAWSYSVMGAQIGLAGLIPVQTSNGTDLIVSATDNDGFGPNNFWYVLHYNRTTGNYDQTYVQPPYSASTTTGSTVSIARMVLANFGSGQELVVGLTNGSFFFYDPITHQQLGEVQLPQTSLNTFQAADTNGDGIAELVVLSSTNLAVYNAAGSLLWSVAGPNGTDLVVAQLDNDPGMEIATTSGHVVDCTTHAIQWTYSSSFGAHLLAANVLGNGHSQIIGAQAWQYISAYDAQNQSVLWTYTTEEDISAIALGNVGPGNSVSLLYADNQFGSVYALALGAATATLEWSIPVPTYDSGVPGILVADVNNDGQNELIIGSGSDDTGADHLDIFNYTTKALLWQSIDLEGPFAAPVLADLFGDGKQELVTASNLSDSGYGSARIMVFDPVTFKLLGISNPIDNNEAWTGLHDLKAADLDGDGKQEIIVAADVLYDGAVEVYDFLPNGTFNLKWTCAIKPEGAPYSQVSAQTINGKMKLILGNTTADTGSAGNFVRVIDYASNTQDWISPALGSTWTGAESMAVGDLFGDGGLEAAVASPGSGIYVEDLINHAQIYSRAGNYQTVLFRPGSTGFIAGGSDGIVTPFNTTTTGRSFAPGAAWIVAPQGISGLTAGPGASLWISSGNRVELWPNSAGPLWSSADLGGLINGPVATTTTAQGLALFAGTPYGAAAFDVGGSANFTTLNVTSAGSLLEGDATPASFTFTLSAAATSNTTVHFSLTGSATADTRYTVSGATQAQDGSWLATIPAGKLSAAVTLGSITDKLAEGTQSIVATVLSSPGYFLGAASQASLQLFDSAPVISVQPLTADAYKVGPKGAPVAGVFQLSRSGNNSAPLLVFFDLGGTAIEGLDYRKVSKAVIFPARKGVVNVRIVPAHLGVVAPDSMVTLIPRPSARTLVSATAGAASINIHDGQPTVSLGGISAGTSGPMVTFNRTATFLGSDMVAYCLTDLAADGTVLSVRFINCKLPRGEASVEAAIPPRDILSTASTITVDLIDDGSFHLGSQTEATYSLDTVLPQ